MLRHGMQRRCLETAAISVMSVVLMVIALTLMRPYGMMGVATALTIAGVYMALMVMIVTARCCSRGAVPHAPKDDPEDPHQVGAGGDWGRVLAGTGGGCCRGRREGIGGRVTNKLHLY